MKTLIGSTSTIAAPFFATAVLLFSSGLLGSCGEAKDNFDSRVVCGDHCDKKFDCADHIPSQNEANDCVSACRSSIEDNCGNEHQAQANDKIAECVDKSCIQFMSCLVFEAAPECLGFVES